MLGLGEGRKNINDYCTIQTKKKGRTIESEKNCRTEQTKAHKRTNATLTHCLSVSLSLTLFHCPKFQLVGTRSFKKCARKTTNMPAT